MAESEVVPDDPQAAELRRRRVIAATSIATVRAASEKAARAKRVRRLQIGIGIAFASAAGLLAVVGVARRVPLALHTASDEAARPIAQVQLLAGSVHRSQKGRPSPSVASDGHFELGPGDEVTTESNGRGEVVLSDGAAITLEPSTHVRLSAATAEPQERVAGLDNGSVLAIRN